MQKVFNRLIDPFNRKKLKQVESELETVKSQISSFYNSPYYHYTPIYNYPYDGEKTPGEMGSAKNYTLLYDYLRIRSWQSYLESEISQIVFNKYILWIIGSGLKIQPEPVRTVLEQEGIKLSDSFVKQVESRFNLWTSSRYSDTCRMHSIDYLSGEAFKNAIVGGDVLEVIRVENGYTTIQVIDGSHVVNPYTDNKYYKEAKKKGNRIEYGVEISGESNEHVAYYVYGADNKIHRIPRYGEKSGRLMSYLIYGNKYRIDNVRGMPLICAVLESLKKLDRYKEATVGSAEERQKIAYSVEHSSDSTGENPLVEKIVQSKNLGLGEAPESKSTDEYEAAATKIATTTQKQAFNMPIGASLKLLASTNELSFKDFYTTNIQLVCASIKIPYEVALSMYNSNYSASRAAIKDWEHSMKTERTKFASQFYQHFYNLWLEMEILKGKIQADGYIKASMDNNIMAIEAYRKARWLGVNVPHIDPLKEVMAERKKLGDDTTPLTTYDQASERLGSGDFSQNMEKIKQEQELIKNTQVYSPKKNGENVSKQLTQTLKKEWQDS